MSEVVFELDGVWDVQRVSGAVPPMPGIRKRIRGGRGSTLVADGRIAVPFDVVGTELHYRAPFNGFVDVLEPGGDKVNGTWTFRGRELGRFTMTRAEEGASSTVNDQLIKHLDEAQAMEQTVLRMLDAMISTTDDPEILQELEHHKVETEGQALRVRQRLEAHGGAQSSVRHVTGILGAVAKMPFDLVRQEKASRNARDGYATEHMEIAAYELLKRIAQKAGDDETAMMCDEIIAQERAMAQKIEANWDKFVTLSLEEQGVTV
jgi:ferritin-like metal-binding protein YciE